MRALNSSGVLQEGRLFFAGMVTGKNDFFRAVTAAGVVPCGNPKKRPLRTSTIVQFIFYFWSFEINRNILRNQKILKV